MLQQKQTCNCGWKQVISIQQSQSSLITQNNQQAQQHPKLIHLAKVPAVVIIAAIVQEIIIPDGVIVKAKIPQ